MTYFTRMNLIARKGDAITGVRSVLAASGSPVSQPSTHTLPYGKFIVQTVSVPGPGGRKTVAALRAHLDTHGPVWSRNNHPGRIDAQAHDDADGNRVVTHDNGAAEIWHKVG